MYGGGGGARECNNNIHSGIKRSDTLTFPPWCIPYRDPDKPNMIVIFSLEISYSISVRSVAREILTLPLRDCDGVDLYPPVVSSTKWQCYETPQCPAPPPIFVYLIDIVAVYHPFSTH